MSNNKNNILVFSDWYLPGFKAGGPIRSLANLVATLDHNFYIVTRITDHHSTEAYPGVVADCWTQISDRVKVYYCSPKKIKGEIFEKLIREIGPDKIYLNSLFSPSFTLTPLRVARKLKLQNMCIVAPRGMLKPGALSIKSKKKKFFLFTAKLIGLYKGVIWHATNEEEITEIKFHFSNSADVRLSVNLPSHSGDMPTKSAKIPGELKLICIARISKEKGILETLQYIKAAELKGKVSCDFYGTEQDRKYLEDCLAVAGSIPNVIIHFHGEINPTLIPEIISDKHFFIMCTWGENFGHAISEALNLATPVIISNRTPWRNLKNKNAGWDLPHIEKEFSEILKKCLVMDNEEYKVLSQGAFELGKEVSRNPESVQLALRLFS